MSIEDNIRHHTDTRRAALAKGLTVLAQLDKRGNINHAAEPLTFTSRGDAQAYQKANRHTLYSLYAGFK